MERILMDDIKIDINIDAISKRLRIEEEEDIERLKQLCDEALEIAVPKVLYKVSYIEDKGNEYVVIDDTKFESGLMAKNFKDINRVFPYTATCGREVYDWAMSVEDMFERYWADHIMEVILRSAVKSLYSDIKSKYGIEKLSAMNPGSLDGWPIEDQQILFTLLEDVKEDTGIELTESFLMVPQKSVSGILFTSSTDYVNCKLCERKNCGNRRAPFDKELSERLK